MVRRGDSTTAHQGAPAGASELVILEGEKARVSQLSPRGSLVIGRSDDADLVLDHPSVSRRHVVLHLGRAIEVEDLGSANGTRIDGAVLERGERRALLHGAIVELGGARLIVRGRLERGELAVSPMVRVRVVIDRVAPSDISVILVGETGVGKEVMSSEIHQRSKRALGPFVRLNCAAFPENLLESELFGYEKGAFSGAEGAKPGLLETATGGTLLLDEIGELPAAIQPKLLRVLENREVQRLGALRARKVDVRVLSATNRDLDVLAIMGQFRQDLLFRLNGITVQLPPLRDRPMEIPSLTDLFVADAAERAGHPVQRLSDAARTLLISYRWPGNVRELRNVLERAVLLCTDGCIGVEHIVLGKAGAIDQVPRSLVSPAVADAPPTSGIPSERVRIVEALARCGGNQAAAAQALGMTRRMLGYRIEKLGLPRPRKSKADEG